MVKETIAIMLDFVIKDEYFVIAVKDIQPNKILHSTILIPRESVYIF